MPVEMSERLTELARRAGLKDVTPQAVNAFLVLCVVAVAWSAWRWWPAGDQGFDRQAQVAGSHEATAEAEGGHTETGAAEATASVMVHVVGAVRRPGVYTLAEGARVRDAVESAGGLLPDAVPAMVNFARPLTDGEQVVIPDEDQAAKGAPVGGAAPSAAAPASALVNINTADAALLDTLPGVGPSTAAKIIADREKNGPFKSLEDLTRVSGIGPKRVEQMEGLAGVK